MYYIGIDGGGTASRMAVINKNGDVIGNLAGKTTNIAANPYQTILDNLKELFCDFSSKYNIAIDDCSYMLIGSAGVGRKVHNDALAKAIREAGYAAKLNIINDGELVLLAGVNNSEGMAIISGTGSIGYALDSGGKIHRAGGWGHLLGDEGSAYYIGLSAIKSALMDFDGIKEAAELKEAIMRHFRLDSIDNVLEIIYNKNFDKGTVAKLAKLVCQKAKEGDKVAKEIEENAAKSLISLAKSLAEVSKIKSESIFNIITSGSVLEKNEHISNIFSTELQKCFPNSIIAPLGRPVEILAAFMARSLFEQNGGNDEK